MSSSAAVTVINVDGRAGTDSAGNCYCAIARALRMRCASDLCAQTGA